MRKGKVLVALVLFACLLLFAGTTVFADAPVLRMATTTSTDNTGLLDYLAPYANKSLGIELQWVAVGTGKALELGKNCDVDVLMVHAPETELQYVKDGYGKDRTQFMYNDFVIIGPAGDPAGARGKSVPEAMKKIRSKPALFASRGDNSGTHVKELELWKLSGIVVPQKESWYIETGQGMINTINIAAECDAYTLTDRGTFIKYESNWEGKTPLIILIEGDKSLRNQYSVIAVNPTNCSKVRYDLATEYIKWISAPEAQRLIADFKLMGKQLFIPNAGE
ncbi:MAG: substrate-binding domain-containing protein [Spirochaetes bacterium]|nr:substrate-binding domain-containing protein [Spirochaetota bacterium]